MKAIIIICIYSSQPSYKLTSHLVVWGFSLVCGVALIVLTVIGSPGEAGTC